VNSICLVRREETSNLREDDYKVRASGRAVIPQYLYETQMICNQAQAGATSYNSAAANMKLQANRQAVAAIYSSHPNHQNRIAAVAALTDSMAGRRSLESLMQYDQSYRVMAALKQTNSAILSRIESVEVVPKSPAVTTGQPTPAVETIWGQARLETYLSHFL
jgi:hypothetical protein